MVFVEWCGEVWCYCELFGGGIGEGEFGCVEMENKVEGVGFECFDFEFVVDVEGVGVVLEMYLVDGVVIGVVGESEFEVWGDVECVM